MDWTRLDFGACIRRQLGLLVALLVVAPLSAGAAVFNVNTTDDDSDDNAGDGICFTGQYIVLSGFFVRECTLRAAIEESNALTGYDEIQFSSALPQIAGIVEFSPATALPWIYDGLHINGYSHPDFDESNPNETPEIQIIGGAVSGTSAGLSFLPGSDNSQVRGVAIADFPGSGILIAPFFSPAPTGIVIQGSHIGVWRGVFYRGNGEDGIHLIGANNHVIGQNCTSFLGCMGLGNVIASNTRHGVHLDGTSTNNAIAGNRIGTDRYGNSTFVPFGGSTRNGEWGVFVGPDATNNDVGDVGGIFVPPSGSSPVSAGNLISGNVAGGVRLEGTLNRVRGNLIGTNAAGTSALANQGNGVEVHGDDNTIGAVGVGSNLISGNDSNGIQLTTPSGFTPLRTQIVGNRIGVDATATSTLGNTHSGISLWGQDTEIVSNTIGGNTTGITDNGYDARIAQNHIGTNASGADLGNSSNGIWIGGGGTVIGGFGDGNTIGWNLRGISGGGSSYQVDVFGNWIGTNASGANLGNTLDGISMATAEYQIGGIGGTTNGLANVIGFNGRHGIHARGFSALVRGNYVGTNASGADLGNAHTGIYAEIAAGLPSAVGGLVTDSDLDVAGSGNVVAHNQYEGIVVDGYQEIALRGNRLWNNLGTPVDLGDNGVTPNDPGDLDGGANHLQNTPEFLVTNTSWNDVTGEFEIRYRVDTLPVGSVQYPLTVDFFLHDPWLSPGDQARVFVGSDVYPQAQAGSYRTITLAPLAGSVTPNVHGFVFGGLRATATDDNGNTSELSTQVVPVPEPTAPLMLAAGALGLAGLGIRRRSA